MFLKSDGFSFEFILFMFNQSFSFLLPESLVCPPSFSAAFPSCSASHFLFLFFWPHYGMIFLRKLHIMKTRLLD